MNNDLQTLMANHSAARYIYASPTGKPGPRAEIHGHPDIGVVHSHAHGGSHDH